MAYKFNPFTGTFDEVGAGGGGGAVPDPLTLNTLTVNTLLTAEHIHGNIAGSVYIHVKNTDTVQLAKGTPFYITGTVGASDAVEIQAADSADPTKGPAVGLLEDTLAVNGEGNGTIIGEIYQYDTATPSWNTNDALYVANGGGLTNVEPTSGYRQIVAYAGRIQASTGTLILTGTSIDPVAGSNTQIQFNDNGGFGASTNLTWNESSKEIGINGAGIYSPGANQLALSTGGTGRLFVDASGRVGAGTNTPTTPLHVYNASTGLLLNLVSGQNNAGIQFANSGATDTIQIVSRNNNLEFRTDLGSYKWKTNNAASDAMVIDSSGRVGIGTATPGSALEINAAASTSPFIAKINTSEVARIGSSGRLLVGTSTAANNVEWFGTNYVSPYLQIAGLSQNATQSIISYTNSATATGALYLGKSRGATVGTNTALQNGDIINEVVYAANDGTNFIRSAIISAFVDGALSTDEVPGRLVFYTNNGASGASPTERMRIDSSGDTIFAAVTNKAGILTGAANGKYISWSNSIMYSGRAGTTLSGHINFYNGNGLVGSITTDASATAYNTLSDYRLKENVVPLTGAIDRLNQLQVHRFNFIADPDTTVDGFLAHEAQAVVPECVTGTKDEVDDEGNPVYQGIDQSKLVPLLTAALQEALAEIESLKARVTALEP